MSRTLSNVLSDTWKVVETITNVVMASAFWMLMCVVFTFCYALAFFVAFSVVAGTSNVPWLAPDMWSEDANRVFLYVMFVLAMMTASVIVRDTFHKKK